MALEDEFGFGNSKRKASKEHKGNGLGAAELLSPEGMSGMFDSNIGNFDMTGSGASLVMQDQWGSFSSAKKRQQIGRAHV